jgi:hypothetical protein
VNGYSGYFPASHYRLREELAGFPEAGDLEMLASEGVRTLILAVGWLDREGQAQMDAWIAEGNLVEMPGQLEYQIYRIDP